MSPVRDRFEERTAATDRFELRRARPEDAEEMAENVRQGFESYRSWTKRGWAPPPRDMEAAQIADKLREPASGAPSRWRTASTPATSRWRPGASATTSA